MDVSIILLSLQEQDNCNLYKLILLKSRSLKINCIEILSIMLLLCGLSSIMIPYLTVLLFLRQCTPWKTSLLTFDNCWLWLQLSKSWFHALSWLFQLLFLLLNMLLSFLQSLFRHYFGLLKLFLFQNLQFLFLDLQLSLSLRFIIHPFRCKLFFLYHLFLNFLLTLLCTSFQCSMYRSCFDPFLLPFLDPFGPFSHIWLGFLFNIRI